MILAVARSDGLAKHAAKDGGTLELTPSPAILVSVCLVPHVIPDAVGVGIGFIPIIGEEPGARVAKLEAREVLGGLHLGRLPVYMYLYLVLRVSMHIFSIYLAH